MNKLAILVIVAILSVAQISNADVKIKVTNLLEDSRDSETIAVDLNLLPGFANTKPGVYNDKSKEFIPCQLVDNNGDGTNDELLFQADFKARQTQSFTIVEANAANQIAVTNGAVANYIKQRKDDFAWENDKIAFRVYGQELQRTELTTSGIDVWVKKIEKPVMLDLYKKGHDYYHTDNPLGIDFFNVGQTLGCGGLGVWSNDKLLRSENYYQWKIIANGPIRTIFELTYKPWDMGDGRKISEVKRITLDRGWNFNRIESKFDSDVHDVTFAVGIVKCERDGKPTYGVENEYLGYWQKPDKNFGVIGCGVILTRNNVINKPAEDQENYMILGMAKDNFIVYYAGACWNKNPGFEKEQNWNTLIRKTSKRIESPMEIEIVKTFGKK